MKFGLNENTIEKIVSVFEANPKVDKAWVFGSRAKGNYRPDSDIDIAVKGYDITMEDILKMSVALEGVGCKVDLIDYDAIKEKELREHVDRVGVEVYNNWKEYEFSDLLMGESISYGIVQPGGHTDNGIPIIRVNNIKNGNIIIDEVMKIDPIIENKYQKTRLLGGELLITVVGSIGECAIVPVELQGWNVARAVSVARVKPGFNVKFIEYSFKSEDIKYQLYGNTNDTVQPTLNLSSLKKIVLKLPSLSSQNIIASIVSNLDDKIDLLRRQNQTLESLAETLFRQWFVEEAEENWEVKSLIDIATYLNGLALQKFPDKGNGYLPVIKIREMKQGDTENSEICDIDIPFQYIVKNGDVLFSWSGSLAITLWAGQDGALNQHLFKITSEKYPKWFYYLATKYHLENFKAIAESKSTTMGHIQRHHLDQAKIKVPSQMLFKKFDLVFEPLITKKIENNRQILNLKNLRSVLLPKLMSGEARVKTT